MRNILEIYIDFIKIQPLIKVNNLVIKHYKNTKIITFGKIIAINGVIKDAIEYDGYQYDYATKNLISVVRTMTIFGHIMIIDI